MATLTAYPPSTSDETYSTWQLTWRERWRVLLGQPLWLRQETDGHALQPVRVVRGAVDLEPLPPPLLPALALPTGWKRRTYAEDQPQYRPLPVLAHEAWARPVYSAWQGRWPTRVALACGAGLEVIQLTFGTPPQLVQVEVGEQPTALAGPQP